MNKTLCFTGHRPDRLGGFSGWRAETIQTGVRDKLINVVYRATTAGFNKFISGMALGGDQLWAEAILYIKTNVNPHIELIAAIPFPSQHTMWPMHAQKKYEELLKAANEIFYCSVDPYSAWKMQHRNEWMVDRSAAIVALLGDVRKGGTYNCVKYAAEVGRPILIIDPYTLHESWRRTFK